MVQDDGRTKIHTLTWIRSNRLGKLLDSQCRNLQEIFVDWQACQQIACHFYLIKNTNKNLFESCQSSKARQGVKISGHDGRASIRRTALLLGHEASTRH
jgi:hypothetical protein